MKKFIYFLVFLLVVIAITPWIDGLYFKQQFLDLVVALNQDSHKKINILQYRMGWLSSHIKVNIISEVPNAKDIPPIELTLDEVITHGPIVYDKVKHKFIIAMAIIESNLHLPDYMEQVVLPSQQTQGILQISSTATFDGNWTNHIQSPVINIQIPNVGKVSWQGLTGESNLKLNNERIDSVQSNFTLGAFSASAVPSVQLNMQPVTLSYNGTLHPIGLWIGSFKISIPDLSYTNPVGKKLHIENFNIITTNNVTSNAFYNGSEQLTLQKLELPGNDISTIAPANLTLTANNLSAKGVVDFANFLKNTSSSDITNDDFHNQLITLASKIVTPTATLAADASFNTSLGAFSLTGKASNFAPDPSTSILDMAKTGNVQMNIRIAIPLANKIFESYFQTLAAQTTARSSGANPPGLLPDVSTPSKTVDQSSVEIFNAKIAELMKQGKLTLSQSMGIMDLNNQNLPLDQFTQNINKLRLPPDVATQIISLYTNIITTQQINQQKKLASPIDKTKNTLDEWVKQGYLIQDNNDYTMSVTLDSGVIKLNGKAIEEGPAAKPAVLNN